MSKHSEVDVKARPGGLEHECKGFAEAAYIHISANQLHRGIWELIGLSD